MIWSHFMDTRVYRGAKLDTDHFLLISKIKSPKPQFHKKTQKVVQEEKFKIQLLDQESIRKLQHDRLKVHIKLMVGNVEMDWKRFKESVKIVANENLGTQKWRYKKRLKIWNEEIREAT